MEKQIIPDIEKVEQIIKGKNFNQLTNDEKALILSIISEKEYENYALFLRNLESSNNVEEIEPSSGLKDNLDNILSRQKKKGYIVPFIKRRTAWYQTIAAALLFFLLGYWVNLQTNNSQKSTDITQNIIHDTIEIVKTIQEPIAKQTNLAANNFSNKMSKKFQKSNNDTQTNIANENEDKKDEKRIDLPENHPTKLLADIAEKSLQLAMKEKNGESISGDTVLGKMLVTIN